MSSSISWMSMGFLISSAKLAPKRKRDSTVSFHAALLIYFMRITAGLSFFWHILPVILQSQALMRLIGFNGREVREGTSERGEIGRAHV